MSTMLFTSESVTEGHPDKICDQISDGILDALLQQDPESRVACETLVKTGLVLLAGEVTSKATVDFTEVARSAVREIGYDDKDSGFDADTCGVITAIEEQSADISRGVDGEGIYTKKEQGAGDQGMMFGYACDQTPEYMPMPIILAHKLTEQLATARKSGKLPWLRPDGKSQVTVRYEDDRPVGIDTIVISTQHREEVAYDDLRAAVMEEVIRPIVPESLVDASTKFFINPTGRFVIGGPKGDSGLTGRKIIVDTYGGWGRHGGGAFSGKDPSKVDRSGAYYARYIAKNIVAAKLAASAEVQLAYAIGVAEPVSILVQTAGTATVPESNLASAVRKVFDCRPRAIVEELDLLRPIYRASAAYGHFGREASTTSSPTGFTWERLDRVEKLKAAL